MQPVVGVALVVGLATGCSSDGQVSITNNTGTLLSGELNDRGFALSGFESIQLTVKVGTRVLFFGPDEKRVDLVMESCTLFPQTTSIVVISGETQSITVQPDAVCINAENQGTFDVLEVSRRNVTDDPDAEWEIIDIGGPLNANESIAWRLEQGLYEVRHVDECEDTTIVAIDASVLGTEAYARHVGEEFCE
jgi:hypothetical protein